MKLNIKQAAIAGAILFGAVTAPAMAQAAETASAEAGSNTVLVTRDQAVNAAPLGLELGYANIAGTRAALADLGLDDFRSAGVNKYTEGEMYVADPAALQVEGLNSVVFVFSPDETLQAVAMTFNKDPRGMAKNLAGKYKQLSNKINNHMNYGDARFEKGDSVIDIKAPHLSFEMDVEYKTKAFNKAMQDVQENERKSSNQRRDGLL